MQTKDLRGDPIGMRFVSIFVLNVILNWIFVDSEDCIFKDSNGTGYILDLSGLSQSVLVVNDTSTHENYSYSPCRDGIICPQDTIYSCMVASNIQETYGDLCTNIAWWNDSIEPYYEASNETWIFKYENAECIGYYPQRFQFLAYYHCNPKAELYHVQSMKTSDNCLYEMHIDSNLACANIYS